MNIKLKLAVTIEVVQKTGKDSSVHLLIELAEETLDLRIQPQGERTALEEAERWKTLLLQWKDYSIDHGERERGREIVRERENLCVTCVFRLRSKCTYTRSRSRCLPHANIVC